MARVALEDSFALAWPDAMRHPDSYDFTVAGGRKQSRRATTL